MLRKILKAIPYVLVLLVLNVGILPLLWIPFPDGPLPPGAMLWVPGIMIAFVVVGWLVFVFAYEYWERHFDECTFCKMRKCRCGS